MTNNELSKELEIWFKSNNLNQRDMLSKNPVAKTLKENLTALKRWKNFGPGRAASRKGYEASMRSRNGGEENDRNEE